MSNATTQKQFGAQVRALRKLRAISQEDLAEQIKKSTDTVSNIERGASAPRLSTMFAIARALDVDVRDLFPPSRGRPRSKSEVEREEVLRDLARLAESRSVAVLRKLIALGRIL